MTMFLRGVLFFVQVCYAMALRIDTKIYNYK